MKKIYYISLICLFGLGAFAYYLSCSYDVAKEAFSGATGMLIVSGIMLIDLRNALIPNDNPMKINRIKAFFHKIGKPRLYLYLSAFLFSICILISLYSLLEGVLTIVLYNYLSL